MNNAEKLHERLSDKLSEIKAICAEHGADITPTMLLRHELGPTFSMLVSNDDLNKVVLCIAELGGIGEVVEDEEKESQQP